MSELTAIASIGVKTRRAAGLLIASAALACMPVQAQEQEPLAVERSSTYAVVRDATLLAVDIYRPVASGDTIERLPVILTMTPYQRARRDGEGNVVPDATAEYWSRHGYVVVIGDVRGKGASFGSRGAPSDQLETDDVHDIIEWAAVQPWSNGRVAMHGCSYVGSTVIEGLRSRAPHLVAAAVGSTQFDQMSSFTEGGQRRTRPLSDEMAGVDAHMAGVVPVDADVDGSMARSTRADKEGNLLVGDIWSSIPFRDSVSSITGDAYWITASAYSHLDAITGNDVPIYMYGSWHDPFIDETMNAWRNYPNATNLVVSRGAHCRSPDFDRDADLLRFFDHHLKGADNGFDEVPRVRYYLEGGRAGHEWQSAPEWPLPAENRRYVLGVANDIGVMGDTALQPSALTVMPPEDLFPFVNFSVVRSGIDPLSVTFTSERLRESELVAGTPVVNLTVSAPADDYVVNAYLEHVNPMRSPEVISRGELLASRRHLGEAPFDAGGLPWPTHREADALPVGANEPVTLTFPLSPMARRLNPGDQLRLAVTLRVNPDDPVLPLTVHTGEEGQSWVDIPVAVDDSGDGQP